jgi:hypothetical protein
MTKLTDASAGAPTRADLDLPDEEAPLEAWITFVEAAEASGPPRSRPARPRFRPGRRA